MNTFVRFYNNRPARVNGLTQHHPAFCNPAELDDLFAGLTRSRASDEAASAEIRLDVTENESSVVVRAAIAGAKKEDILLDVDKNIIKISVDIKRDETTHESERTLLSERQFGKATRRVVLRCEVDETTVQAKYADGILTLMLPKKAPPQATRININ